MVTSYHGALSRVSLSLLKKKTFFQASLSHTEYPWLWSRKQTCELTCFLQPLVFSSVKVYYGPLIAEVNLAAGMPRVKYFLQPGVSHQVSASPAMLQ